MGSSYTNGAGNSIGKRREDKVKTFLSTASLYIAQPKAYSKVNWNNVLRLVVSLIYSLYDGDPCALSVDR